MATPIELLQNEVKAELGDSVTIIVLGASGDLAKKKTYPALFGLFRNGFLPKNTHIDYLERITQYIKPGDNNEHKSKIEEFKKITSYVSGLYDKDEAWQAPYLYMALPPSIFIPVAKGVKKNVYGHEGVNRLIVEKPFGMDSESSNHLAHELGQLFKEDEIYRIDHYLGKGNGQEQSLLQVLSLIAMERPISTDAEAIRDEKVKVLKCISPISLDDALLGQYVAANGKPGYLEDETLKNKESRTPTFAALACHINNERWEGVPFILKAGKALNEAKVEVRIQFRHVPGNLYGGSARNELVMRIQPKEAVYMKFNNKQPGLSYQTIQTDLDLSYHKRYTELSIPDAYESLILDVLRNDHSNFVRDDELEAAWKIFTPLLHKIDGKNKKSAEGKDSGDDLKITTYAYGSRGPAELDEFVKSHGYDRTNAHYSWPHQSVAALSNKL
ncbi:glucose-6-phosphate dehydrogenase [Phycomyces blakesleeanus]|uniref:Glucose-6-phosphate 1-dehydrogenase n=1 Tax=Phycomyces blakesleeanus TaxID=4837 RepID=A0ABR3B2I5_PHYBL